MNTDCASTINACNVCITVNIQDYSPCLQTKRNIMFISRVLSFLFQQWVHQVYVGRIYPSASTPVIVTQHVASLFWPYSRVCLLECCFSATSIGEDPQRALDYRDRENKEDELPAACQIQLEQPKDSSRHQSEASRNKSRLQTASACMANRAACVTWLYEHVNRRRQTGTLCDGPLQGMKMMILKSACEHIKVLDRFRISMPENYL